MNTRMVALPATDPAVKGPALIVVLMESGETIKERYLQYKAGKALPAGRPLAAVIRSFVLSVADEVQVKAHAFHGMRCLIEVMVRRYEGPLAANDERIVLAEVDLGCLTAGGYEITVAESTVVFIDRKRPENTGTPMERSYGIRFRVK